VNAVPNFALPKIRNPTLQGYALAVICDEFTGKDKMKCPSCPAEIDVKEQMLVFSNFFVCANCGTVIYRR